VQAKLKLEILIFNVLIKSQETWNQVPKKGGILKIEYEFYRLMMAPPKGLQIDT